LRRLALYVKELCKVQEERSKKYYIYYALFVLFKKKWLIASTTFLFFFLVFFYSFLTTPLWKGTAKILVDYHPKQQLVIFPDASSPVVSKPEANPINDLVSILTGQEMAREVVERFNRDDMLQQVRENPKRLPDKIKKSIKAVLIGTPKAILTALGLITPQPDNYLYDAIDDFTENLQDIAVEEDTNIIDIAIYAESPKLARYMANEMASLLIEKVKVMNQETAKQAFLFAKEQESLAKIHLDDAKEELEAFRKEHDLMEVGQQIRINLDRRDELKSEYYKAISDQKATDGQLKEIRNQIDRSHQKLLDSSSIIDNPSIVTLRFEMDKLQLELASMLTYKKENHPDVVRIRAQIQEAKESLREMTEFVVESQAVPVNEHFENLLNQLVDILLKRAELKARPDVLQMQMAEAKKEGERLLGRQSRETTLAAEVETQEEIYDSLRGKMLEFEALQNVPFGNFNLKIVDHAYVFDDQKPDWPLWVINLFVGLMGGLFFGVSMAFVFEYLSEGCRTIEETESGIGLPVISVVPKFGRGKRIIDE